MSAFLVPCPHCGEGNEDPFEVLARGRVDWLMCAHCERRFFYLNLECDHCVEENVLTWPEAPNALGHEVLRCSACGHELGQGVGSAITSHLEQG